METFDVAVVVYARVHGTSHTDAAMRLVNTLKVDIGEPYGPIKRAVGMSPTGVDAFIQVARLENNLGLKDKNKHVFDRLKSQKRDVS